NIIMHQVLTIDSRSHCGVNPFTPSAKNIKDDRKESARSVDSAGPDKSCTGKA
ncbi:hypothetical protein BgiMline_018722, partial [Biomphalaria glabrata]